MDNNTLSAMLIILVIWIGIAIFIIRIDLKLTKLKKTIEEKLVNKK
jgi:CcmD family protein